MAIKLGIIGCAGRMGRRIATLAHEDQDFSITCAIERPDHPAQGVDLGELLGLGKLDVPISSKWSAKPDVLINFTTARATIDSLAAARKDALPMVIGTTGLSPEQLATVKDASKDIAVLQAANMSLAVNLLFRLVGQVAAVLGDDYD
ncbi:unnamed protein product, partial [marine sediment metagenome]